MNHTIAKARHAVPIVGFLISHSGLTEMLWGLCHGSVGLWSGDLCSAQKSNCTFMCKHVEGPVSKVGPPLHKSLHVNRGENEGSTRQHCKQFLHPGRNFPTPPFIVTQNCICVWTKDQNALKKQCFDKYPHTCGCDKTHGHSRSSHSLLPCSNAFPDLPNPFLTCPSFSNQPSSTYAGPSQLIPCKLSRLLMPIFPGLQLPACLPSCFYRSLILCLGFPACPLSDNFAFDPPEPMQLGKTKLSLSWKTGHCTVARPPILYPLTQ